jgi:hypothetical protein
MLNRFLMGPEEGGEGGGGGGGGAPVQGSGKSEAVPYDNEGQDFYRITPEGAKPGNEGKSDKQESFVDDGGNEGEDEGGEGGEGEDFSEGGEGGEGGEEEGEGEGEGAGKPTPTPTLKLDRESLEMLAGLRRQQQEEGEGRPADDISKLTPEQKRALFNPVEVTDQVMAELRSEDPAIQRAGYQKLVNATVTNAVSIARVLLQKEKRAMEEALAPIVAYQQQVQKEQASQGFYKTYPALAKYPKMVKIAAQEVSPTHPDGRQKTREEVYREVAQVAAKELKSLNIQIELTKPTRTANHGAGQGRGQGGVPPPNRFSVPGRSGGDRKQQPPKPNAADADIYVGRRS